MPLADDQVPQFEDHDDPRQTGSRLIALSTDRLMKSYNVTENELRTLTAWNDRAAASFAAGTSSLGIAFALLTDYLRTSVPTPVDIVLGSYVTWILAFAAVYFFWDAYRLRENGKSVVGTIRDETVPRKP